MSIFLISPAFAEPVDVEIDWTIEGQPKTIVNPSMSESIDQNQGNDLNTFNEKIQKKWDDRIDSVSYAIGLDVAMRLDQQFDQFNHKRINKAILKRWK